MTMFANKQQTRLGAQDLVLQLSKHPSNATTLVNDLGIIFLNQTTPVKEIDIAEGALIRALRSRNENTRKTAYYHLKHAHKAVSNYAQASMEVFKHQVMNKHIINYVATHHWLS